MSDPAFPNPIANLQTHIRLLTRQDAPAYQTLRLTSLQEKPEAFLSTFESEVKLHEEMFADHLDWAYHPPHLGYFGMFLEDELIGYVQVSKTYLEKQEHIVMLNNLYFASKHRGHGLAQALFQHIFEILEQTEHVERVFLSCTAKNKSALEFYRKLGFRRYAVRARAIKWQGAYDDEIEMVKILQEKVPR